jgi:16S rRNA (guanine966-N2)-methyltransferase
VRISSAFLSRKIKTTTSGRRGEESPVRYQLRIIAGALRGRKLKVASDPGLRPIADRAREALFSILGDAVPGRLFLDVFAGSGAVGIEALSRGAKSVIFVEREPRVVTELIQHLKTFGVAQHARVLRADAYRWGEKWIAPSEPVNIFLGPPYREFDHHLETLAGLVRILQQQTQPGSVLILQSDRRFPSSQLPDADAWDVRFYGRTQLALWIQPPSEKDSA